ncbi:protoheme IX farnesyltransferase [Infirmifilum sp. NZ]|uniref:protoheme IX farnesyltransferase n=1 Tax=Infirmifilum sp. NZ TaxID=2926850 RepID=UPI0027A946EB|nr:protoheme IX farnesyltransferase [Infirmifilum sp. NZ]UNQ73853.1 protoheme IX farnesyltransferase [Infirmifilum sp. NZ]
MRIRDIADLFKLRQTFMAVLTGVVAYIKPLGFNVDLRALTLISISLFATVAGATGFNMLFDMDIDSIMPRTRHRPLPSGRMTPRQALWISAITVAAGLVLASLINVWVLFFGVLGFLIFSFLYTKFMKRKTPWSVVICGTAGAMPVLGGWSAATGEPSLEAALLATLVVLWSYVHIWTAATYFSEDYRLAGVPMLPVALGEKAGLVASLTALALVVADLALMWLRGVYSTPSAAALAVLATAIAAVLLKGLFKGEFKRSSYVAWKLATAFIAAAFVLLFI